MTRSRKIILAAVAMAGMGVAGAAAAQAPSSPSNYNFPSGFEGFKLLTRGGDFNPDVVLGFNPDTEHNPPSDHNPPGYRTTIDLNDPTKAILTNFTDGGSYNFLIGLLDLEDGLLLPAVAPPDERGFTGFTITSKGHDISVLLQFGGSPISSFTWGAFNPQPDPPGDWGGGVIGFAADPFMSFQLFVDGRQESFSLADAVPEPATWGLMLVGFGGMGAMLRSRRRLAMAA